MNILDKYAKLRPQIKDGDVILFHGTAMLAKIIQNCDRDDDGTLAYHNHVGIVVEKHGALFIVDSNASGVQADRLSWRINSYKKGGDFTIIKPLCSREEIDAQMEILLKRSDAKWIRYDYFNGAKELANRRWGWNLNITIEENLDICSDYPSRYVSNLDMMLDEFKAKKIVFPEDYYRYINIYRAKIIN